MIDSHAHLYWDSFQEDFEEILDRALQAGMTAIINIGVDLETSQKAIKQASEIGKIKTFATVGYHPNDAIDSLPHLDDVSIHKLMEDLENLCKNSPEKVVAIGECGLDYYQAPPSPFSKFNQVQDRKDSGQARMTQIAVLKAQVELAKQLNLPLVIHCREAWDEIFDYLEGTQGLFHCWSGTLEEAQKALDLGFYISFAGNITYKKADNLREVAKQIPLERILIETDSPFLSPEGKRGQRNEPANVLDVAKTIAKVRGMPLEEVIQITAENTKELFKITN